MKRCYVMLFLYLWESPWVWACLTFFLTSHIMPLIGQMVCMSTRPSSPPPPSPVPLTSQPATLSGVFTPDLVTFGAAVAACEAAVISDKYGDLIQRIIQLTWAVWLVHMLSISIYLGYLDVFMCCFQRCCFCSDARMPFFLWNTHFTTARLVDNGTWRCTSWRKRRPSEWGNVGPWTSNGQSLI